MSEARKGDLVRAHFNKKNAGAFTVTGEVVDMYGGLSVGGWLLTDATVVDIIKREEPLEPPIGSVVGSCDDDVAIRQSTGWQITGLEGNCTWADMRSRYNWDTDNLVVYRTGWR